MDFIKVKHKGNFNNTERFFDRALKRGWMKILDGYAQRGVELLKEATPKDSGITAESWNYVIEEGNGMVSISWTNDNENDGVNIIYLIIYGHGLWNGAYVEGNDFVHPTILPLMQELADKAWEEVTEVNGKRK